MTSTGARSRQSCSLQLLLDAVDLGVVENSANDGEAGIDRAHVASNASPDFSRLLHHGHTTAVSKIRREQCGQSMAPPFREILPSSLPSARSPFSMYSFKSASVRPV